VPNQKRARQKAARQRKIEAQRRMQKRSQMMRRGVILTIVAAVIITTVALLASSGNSKPGVTTTTTTLATASKAETTAQAAANHSAVAHGCPSSPLTAVNTLMWKKAPTLTINKEELYYAHVSTTAGNFVIELEPKLAPYTVNNFIFLSDHNYYKCNAIFRVIPGFMMQTGDATGTGSGSPGYTIPDEYPKKLGNPTYPLYSVAMANGGPNTTGAQFFIVGGLDVNTLSLQNTYSLFGKVISGQRVVTTIVNYGNPNENSNGEPPFVTERILKVTISTTS
jgi:cyclophilin family peptidyl-prolyl cis-trans isomerase